MGTSKVYSESVSMPHSAASQEMEEPEGNRPREQGAGQLRRCYRHREVSQIVQLRVSKETLQTPFLLERGREPASETRPLPIKITYTFTGNMFYS